MAKRRVELQEHFTPEEYELIIKDNTGRLIIKGQKLSRPNKRIVLHQKGLKVRSAQIVRLGKKADQSYELARINHLPTFQQVRLHTNEMIYPGSYKITVDYDLTTDKIQKLREAAERIPSRELMPSVDEKITRAKVAYKLIYIDDSEK